MDFPSGAPGLPPGLASFAELVTRAPPQRSTRPPDRSAPSEDFGKDLSRNWSHLLQNMFGILECLLCEIALPLHFDIEGLRDVRNDDVNEATDAKDDVLKDDDEGKLQGEDFPVDRSEGSGVVAEPSIVAFRLKLGNTTLDYVEGKQVLHNHLSKYVKLLVNVVGKLLYFDDLLKTMFLFVKTDNFVMLVEYWGTIVNGFL